MIQKCYWLSLFYVFICNTIIGETAIPFSNACPRFMYQKQDYDYTLRIPDTRISANILVDNLYHINKPYGHVNCVCYRYMGKTTLPRPSNPKAVIDKVKQSCDTCDAGHLIPHLYGGTTNIRNYFSQDSILNKGFWSQVERSLEFKPIINTTVTIQLLYKYSKKDSDVYNLLPYPPPTHIQAVIMDDRGDPNNDNPFIHECMNIRNLPNHHFDSNILIKKYLEEIPLIKRVSCIN